jgi:hypothetical protein
VLTSEETIRFVQIYTDYFFSEDISDKYSILKSSVAMKILNSVYRTLMNDETVIKIENLPQEKKLFFWNISGRYYEDTLKRKSASIAAYTISLITATE